MTILFDFQPEDYYIINQKLVTYHNSFLNYFPFLNDYFIDNVPLAIILTIFIFPTLGAISVNVHSQQRCNIFHLSCSLPESAWPPDSHL